MWRFDTAEHSYDEVAETSAMLVVASDMRQNLLDRDEAVINTLVGGDPSALGQLHTLEGQFNGLVARAQRLGDREHDAPQDLAAPRTLNQKVVDIGRTLEGARRPNLGPINAATAALQTRLTRFATTEAAEVGPWSRTRAPIRGRRGRWRSWPA